MRLSSVVAMIVLGALTLPARAADQPPAAVARKIQQSIGIVRLVEAFTKAQHDFDQPQLRALTAESYVEISPIGEVDPRDKMLGFYDPAKLAEAPPMTLGERSVRMIGGDAAVMVTSISYDIPAKDGPRTVSMRAVFVAQRECGAWKLVSVQYTPIRVKS